MSKQLYSISDVEGIYQERAATLLDLNGQWKKAKSNVERDVLYKKMDSIGREMADMLIQTRYCEVLFNYLTDDSEPLEAFLTEVEKCVHNERHITFYVDEENRLKEVYIIDGEHDDDPLMVLNLTKSLRDNVLHKLAGEERHFKAEIDTYKEYVGACEAKLSQIEEIRDGI